MDKWKPLLGKDLYELIRVPPREWTVGGRTVLLSHGWKMVSIKKDP